MLDFNHAQGACLCKREEIMKIKLFLLSDISNHIKISIIVQQKDVFLRHLFLNLGTIDMIIVCRQAKDQGQTSLIKTVDILPHTNLMEGSNPTNDSLDDFLASMPRFDITK